MPLRALIVDDESPARLQLRLRLERFPEVEVVGEAQSGREALELLRALDYDVVFIDIRMPGLSGLEVAEALKNRSPRPGSSSSRRTTSMPCRPSAPGPSTTSSNRSTTSGWRRPSAGSRRRSGSVRPR